MRKNIDMPDVKQRAMNRMKKYKVTWGEGQSQGNLSKTEALKIAGDLLKHCAFVNISNDR